MIPRDAAEPPGYLPGPGVTAAPSLRGRGAGVHLGHPAGERPGPPRPSSRNRIRTGRQFWAPAPLTFPQQRAQIPNDNNPGRGSSPSPSRRHGPSGGADAHRPMAVSDGGESVPGEVDGWSRSRRQCRGSRCCCRRRDAPRPRRLAIRALSPKRMHARARSIPTPLLQPSGRCRCCRVLPARDPRCTPGAPACT